MFPAIRNIVGFDKKIIEVYSEKYDMNGVNVRVSNARKQRGKRRDKYD